MPAEPVFVDTNVFLRYLTNDVPDQAEAVERLILQAERGEISLLTNALVIAEIVWVLESYYDVEKPDVRAMVSAILTADGLRVERRDLILQAISDYVEKNIDFADAYNGAWALSEGISSAATFDAQHFSRIEGLSVIVPD